MSEIIAFINQKGGTAKSTTALCVGQFLHLQSKKVLLVDMDAQQNLTYSMGIESKAKDIMCLLEGSIDASEIIQHAETGDVIPASYNLSGADIFLTGAGKEYKLKEALKAVRDYYDYIIIDTPPALSILTINALAACDNVIIPAQADIYSLQGVVQLSKTIQTVKQYCNKDLTIKGIVLTRYNRRAVLSRDLADMLSQTAETLGTKLYKTTIRECIAIKEAQARKQSIFTYAPLSNASVDYNNLVNELIK